MKTQRSDIHNKCLDATIKIQNEILLQAKNAGLDDYQTDIINETVTSKCEEIFKPFFSSHEAEQKVTEEQIKSADSILSKHVSFQKNIDNANYTCVGIPYKDALQAVAEALSLPKTDKTETKEVSEALIQFVVDGKHLSKQYTPIELLNIHGEEGVLEDMEECTCSLNESTAHCEGDCIQYENSEITGYKIVSVSPSNIPLREEKEYCYYCGKQSCVAQECLDN